MKCPKCGYLGFEPVERCRNCGYDFSLSQSVSVPELPIRLDGHDADPNPLDDLALVDAALAGDTLIRRDQPVSGLDRILGVRSRPAGSAELPLFGSPILEDDQPLITRPSPPRAPLAVRRSTPEVPRLRAAPPRMQTLDLDLDAPKTAEPAPSADDRAKEGWIDRAPDRSEDAGAGARLVAVALDLVILGAVDALVIYFTMQICGLSLGEMGVLPKGPLLAFLLVQNGGYLVAFTAGGQTLGKMAVGIKVVTAASPSSVDLGRAFLRELLWLILAVPAGLGFLTIFARDHRGLHDRFAGTRVVR